MPKKTIKNEILYLLRSVKIRSKDPDKHWIAQRDITPGCSQRNLSRNLDELEASGEIESKVEDLRYHWRIKP